MSSLSACRLSHSERVVEDVVADACLVRSSIVAMLQVYCTINFIAVSTLCELVP